MTNKFNPFHWVCDKDGCYNKIKRPNFGVFFDCFPKKISMSDIDATVEINGHFLFLEFKDGRSVEIPTGQKIYFERLTALSPRVTGVVVHMDIELMESRAIRVVKNGHIGDWQICTTLQLKKRLSQWAVRAAAGK